MLSCTDSDYIFTFSCLASFYHFQTDGGEKRRGVRVRMLVTPGLKANPRYGAIRKVLQKELAFMATKNVNKRIVRAIWC